MRWTTATADNSMRNGFMVVTGRGVLVWWQEERGGFIVFKKRATAIILTAFALPYVAPEFAATTMDVRDVGYN